MRRLFTILPLLAAATSCTAAAGMLGGGRTLTPVEVARLDTADAVRAARRAQMRFENTRWSHLPWAWRTGSGSDCDEIVGRFCLRFGDSADGAPPPEEHGAIPEAREELLTMLAAATSANPSDFWIVGQKVRYLIEAGRPDEAESAVLECGAERWWCLALAGYVSHASAEFAEAEASFDEALRAMPEGERRRWTDLSVLLAPAARRGYRRLEPAERAARERRFWLLADPMASIPGNERRTEHFSRHVLARLAEDARSPERVSWGDDLRELLLRYGPTERWQRVRPRAMSLDAPGVLSRFAGGPEDLPGWEQTVDPAAMVAEASHPHTLYAPPYADELHELEHQVAVFRRGDSTRVVAAWRVLSDSIGEDDRVEAALVALGDTGDAMSMSTGFARGSRGALAVTAGARSIALGVEVLAREARWAARARAGALPPWTGHSITAVSDLMLIDPVDPLPASLAAAVPLARAGTRLSASEQLGVFWEMYGSDDVPRQAFVTLSLTRGRVGWVRRLAERVGLAREFDGLKLQWEERLGSGVLPRAVVLDFERLSPGAYVLELVVSPVGRPSATVTRGIEIVR